jgi:hypothetical protein
MTAQAVYERRGWFSVQHHKPCSFGFADGNADASGGPFWFPGPKSKARKFRTVSGVALTTFAPGRAARHSDKAPDVGSVSEPAPVQAVTRASEANPRDHERMTMRRSKPRKGSPNMAERPGRMS